MISQMADDMASDLLKTLKEKTVASILAAMDPQRATQLSTLMVSRVPASVETPEQNSNHEGR